MPKICYRPRTFSSDVQGLIDKANEIIAEYTAQGYELTLRQLYYQFVSRDIIPNTMRSYKNLGTAINNGRLAGLIDWEAIVDRTRNLRTLPTWESPRDIVDACARQFRTDRWANQPCYVEVWIEKDALVGVIEGVCNELRVPHFSCRGYTSQSEMWEAAQRLTREISREGRERALIIHLGDHDPSGMDMSRDIEERLREFGDPGIEVNRIALNMPQIERYRPPPNPAKITDSRSDGYIAAHGESSWELDALEPQVISRLVRRTILDNRDEELWEQSKAEEDEGREALERAAQSL